MDFARAPLALQGTRTTGFPWRVHGKSGLEALLKASPTCLRTRGLPGTPALPLTGSYTSASGARAKVHLTSVIIPSARRWRNMRTIGVFCSTRPPPWQGGWVDRIFASAEAEAVFLLAVSNDPEDEVSRLHTPARLPNPPGCPVLVAVFPLRQGGAFTLGS